MCLCASGEPRESTSGAAAASTSDFISYDGMVSFQPFRLSYSGEEVKQGDDLWILLETSSWNLGKVFGFLEETREVLLIFEHEVDGRPAGDFLSFPVEGYEIRKDNGEGPPLLKKTGKRKNSERVDESGDKVGGKDCGNGGAKAGKGGGNGGSGKEQKQSARRKRQLKESQPPTQSDEPQGKQPRMDEAAALQVDDAAVPATVVTVASNSDQDFYIQDMSPAQVSELTAGQLSNAITKRAGAVFDVAGNGTCWLYAAMGSLQCLQHAWTPSSPNVESHTPQKKPTPRDVRLSQVLLVIMLEHFKTLPIPDKRLANGDVLKDYELLRDELQVQNVWVPEMGDLLAKFGNEKHMYLLSHALERRIIVLHGPTMTWLRNRRNALTTKVNGRAPRHMLHRPDSKSVRPNLINEVRVLQELESYPDTLVIEHNGDCHYQCLRLGLNDRGRDDLPEPLARALRDETVV